jgi:hypothetical protein
MFLDPQHGMEIAEAHADALRQAGARRRRRPSSSDSLRDGAVSELAIVIRPNRRRTTPGGPVHESALARPRPVTPRASEIDEHLPLGRSEIDEHLPLRPGEIDEHLPLGRGLGYATESAY